MKITHRVGNFNWLDRDEMLAVIVVDFPPGIGAPNVQIKMNWKEGDDPWQGHDVPPSTYIEAFQERLDSYMFASDRSITQDSINWWRENAAFLDSIWAAHRIEQHESAIAYMQRQIDMLRGYLVEVEL